MNDPRDFLPAKYKKNPNDKEFKGSTLSLSDFTKETSQVETKEIPDSPWSDLAKQSKIPEYRSVDSYASENKKDNDFSATLNNNLGSLKSDDSKENSPKNAFVPKKKKNVKLAGLLVVFFLVVGVFSSYMLSQQNQDVRQQASVGTPYDVDENRFGWCGGCNPPRPATEADWANMDVQVSGTYVWNGMRYIIDLPATHEAAIDYATHWPGINDYVGDPDGVGDIELAPFYMCGTGDAYNVINCSTDASLCSIIENGRCYLTPEAYQAEQDLGHTWVPDGVGCGDGVHDPIDCQEWHFTTCLNQGSGVNGYGCDAEDNGNIDEDDDDEITTTTTTTITTTTTVTQPPTVTTTAPGPICSNIEMLDSTGNIMAADDDENLKNGDQVKFRATATNTANAAVTYEFRIWAPNMSTWINITNTDTNSGAANVSATYTIVASGHHVVQSRICVSGVCQAWETVTGAPETIQVGTTCTTDANCAADYYCYIDPTPSGAQTLVAPTGNYCKAKQNCTTDANCAAGQTCYQPPMPVCPSGMSCTQVMPPKFCKEQ